MLRVHLITSLHFIFAYKLPRLKIKKEVRVFSLNLSIMNLLARKHKNRENIVISATINQIERNEQD